MNIDKLEKRITKRMENKWFPVFSKQAKFIGNGIYTIAGLHSTDTRELFIMFVAQQELGIQSNELMGLK